jgi:phospholipid-binding lipoprotein MlaA
MKPDRLRAHRPFASSILALSFALAGCATTGQAANPRDPWEPFNRHVYKFNEGLDRVVLKPAATWYHDFIPPQARTGVSNFFGNLGDLWSAANSLMQFHLQDAEESVARFQLNTMFGLFGLFDIASDVNIERHREDFGQTLGRWGVPSGPYLMLPFFGPSTLRDASALPVDWHFDPLRQVENGPTRDVAYFVRVIDKRANLLRVGNVLEEVALDKYSFTRDAYLQRRNAEVKERDRGEEQEPPPPLPDESKEPSAPAAPAGQPASAPAR